MDIVLLIGRILFAMIFVGSGIGHLVDTQSTAAAAARRGVEPAKLMASYSGAHRS
ncbi:MAG: putative oxidoreductase [Myxococcota bacterium]|jgi:putative oxidoreductase